MTNSDGLPELRGLPDEVDEKYASDQGILLSVPIEVIEEFTDGNHYFARVLYLALWDHHVKTPQDYENYQTNSILRNIQQAIKQAFRAEGVRLLQFVREFYNDSTG